MCELAGDFLISEKEVLVEVSVESCERCWG